MVRLGEVLRRNDKKVTLEPDVEYREITVRLWGKGVILRGLFTGAQAAAQRRYVAQAGQFILSRIDARNGALGIVPNELDGAVVSNDFPLFSLDSSRLLSPYLGWMCQTAEFVEHCRRASEGTTNRVRLQAERFLETTIPLPPLAEQRQVVARIEELAAQTREASGLRQQAVGEAEALYEASVGELMSQHDKCSKERLGNLTTKIGSGSTPLGGRATYPSSGIPFIRSLNVRMRHFQWDDIAFIPPETHAVMAGTSVQPNDVLLNITGASIGRVCCAPINLNEGNVNQHVAIIRPRGTTLDSRYLMYWLSQPSIQEYISDKQKGATRQGFTKAQIEGFDIPVPTLVAQRGIVADLDALQAKVDVLKHLQVEIEAELDALLPTILDRAFKGEL